MSFLLEKDKEMIKEFSRICLVLDELKEKQSILKKAKQMFEKSGTEEFPQSLIEMLVKQVGVEKTLLVKETGVKITVVQSKKKKSKEIMGNNYEVQFSRIS